MADDRLIDQLPSEWCSMRDETVVLRTFGDHPVIARVWDTHNDVIVICSEDNYKKLTSGLPGLMPIGFKAHDVFVCTPEIEMKVKQDPNLNLDWESLTPWQEKVIS